MSLVAFGEALMTFKPRPTKTLQLPLAAPACEAIQAIGGAELNVAVAMARVGGPGTSRRPEATGRPVFRQADSQKGPAAQVGPASASGTF